MVQFYSSIIVSRIPVILKEVFFNNQHKIDNVDITNISYLFIYLGKSYRDEYFADYIFECIYINIISKYNR